MSSVTPSAVVLKWAARELGVSELHWVRTLPGGTHATTTVVAASDGTEFVLRQFPPGDDAVRREIRVLAGLGGLGDLAPHLLAADPDGTAHSDSTAHGDSTAHSHSTAHGDSTAHSDSTAHGDSTAHSDSGCPLIVTTLLPGRASITPTDPHDFARQLGAALARIHSLATDPALPDLFTEPRADSPLRSLWRELAGEPRVLTHNDFWSGNTVWQQERLTGIVDWSGAGLAPRGYDLAWCRQDLVFLYDATVAEEFTRTYDEAFGSPTPNVALWDHFAALKAYPRVETWAPNYQDLGRTDLDGAELRRRLTEWMLELGVTGH
ncbi:phosphotransferase family protein [Cryobacterium luteum]|uniref:Aminoglycoside phosphotransferase family protein n=1 Tax=Cryobacterium luteum TaxID=1424661 RepID=A0A1H8I7S2_9MICO|nr:aminoglycoside phosphotransferase family protein [Cryobacterium luteum]TFB95578.1 aminoglycoside phosphotransferase family protein [Cryobacterium luteum]SEN64723.1 Phosphotransferase enzyme family protein [Cryobacterium luteum]